MTVTMERLNFIPQTTERLKAVLENGSWLLIQEALADDLDDLLLIRSFANSIVAGTFNQLVAATWVSGRESIKIDTVDFQPDEYLVSVVSEAITVCINHYPSLGKYHHGNGLLRDELNAVISGEVLQNIVEQIHILHASPDQVKTILAADQPVAESLFRRTLAFNNNHANDRTLFNQHNLNELQNILHDLNLFIEQWEAAKLDATDLRFFHKQSLQWFLGTVERIMYLYDSDAHGERGVASELKPFMNQYRPLAERLVNLGFHWEHFFDRDSWTT
ncbi:hypothetical protein KBC89_02400 [Candidatus Woesebacteria bacterium]|nr:hypothetical protein [Candidatus Woesebacteria bacterium]